MPKYGYLVVEGPHDVEFVYRLLSPFGLKRVQLERDLDSNLLPLVPRVFPHNGELQKRVPVPLFLQSKSHAIALHSAIGDSRLVDTVQENANIIDFTTLTGVGIIFDSDEVSSAGERYIAIKKGLGDKGFKLPSSPGAIETGPPHFGAFVLPDNVSVGNLEDLLIECADVAYPNLLISAKCHVQAAIDGSRCYPSDGADLSKRSFYNKAVVGAIASVLRPGKAIQASIQDNKWLKGASMKIARVKAVQDFLVSLFELV